MPESHFPRVKGENLNRRRFVLPDEFEGTLNLVFIAFHQWHQPDVDSWMPFAKQLAAQYPSLRYYELPTIRRMNPLFQSWIDGGMRAGIPNVQTRDATITLYIDKEPFREALAIDHEDEIAIFLVDSSGTIHWRTGGRYTPQKANSLLTTLEGFILPRPPSTGN